MTAASSDVEAPVGNEPAPDEPTLTAHEPAPDVHTLTEHQPAPDVDEVWAALVDVVTHNLDGWRRAVSESIGMPFSRLRVIRRLAERSLTMGGLAEVCGMDAPAATVAVNDLEKRGLVLRAIDPANRRVRTVALTPAGRQVLARADSIRPPAPPEFARLAPGDVDALTGILSRLSDAAST